jgi:hypothetical protein
VEWALVHKPESVTVRRATKEDGSIVGNQTNLGKFAFTATDEAFQEYYGVEEKIPAVHFAGYPRFFKIGTGIKSCYIKSEEGSVSSNNLERDFPNILKHIRSNFRKIDSQTPQEIMDAATRADDKKRALHARLN